MIVKGTFLAFMRIKDYQIGGGFDEDHSACISGSMSLEGFLSNFDDIGFDALEAYADNGEKKETRVYIDIEFTREQEGDPFSDTDDRPYIGRMFVEKDVKDYVDGKTELAYKVDIKVTLEEQLFGHLMLMSPTWIRVTTEHDLVEARNNKQNERELEALVKRIHFGGETREEASA